MVRRRTIGWINKMNENESRMKEGKEIKIQKV
jgi:hypothetical protein